MSELPSDVLAEIVRIARGELDYSGELTAASTLGDDLQLDSMSLMIMAVGLENRFRVQLREEDAGELKSVGDLVALVCRRVGEQHLESA